MFIPKMIVGFLNAVKHVRAAWTDESLVRQKLSVKLAEVIADPVFAFKMRRAIRNRTTQDLERKKCSHSKVSDHFD